MEDPFLDDEQQLDEIEDIKQRLREEENSSWPDQDVLLDLEKQLYELSPSEHKKWTKHWFPFGESYL